MLATFSTIARSWLVVLLLRLQSAQQQLSQSSTSNLKHNPQACTVGAIKESECQHNDVHVSPSLCCDCHLQTAPILQLASHPQSGVASGFPSQV